MLIKVTLGGVSFFGAIAEFPLAVALRVVKGTKLFRKLSFSKGSVRRRFPPGWSSSRLTDQQIYLLLQKKQLLLHPFNQGNNVSIGFVRYRRWVNA
jgi:hypothetical protein